MVRRTAARILKIMMAFVIFGIIDNGIMLLAGDAIDSWFGAALGISVLAAAGLGNALSDMIGISMGRIMEQKIFGDQDLTGGLPAWQVIAAETVGIVTGCLLGMSVLLVI